MADDSAADLLVIAWQDWRALRARLRTQFSEPWDGDGPAPPGPPVEDTPALPFRVIAWQQWRVSRARLTSQYAGGAFDDSVAVVTPPTEDPPAPPFSVIAWQQWLASRRRLATQYGGAFDEDGPPPPAVIPDFPPPNFTVIAWQQWRAGRAQLQTQFTDAPQDVDAFPQLTPDQSLVVLPWFAGRVPMEAIRNYIFSGEQTDASGPAPDLALNEPPFTANRTTWRGIRWSTRAIHAYAFAMNEENLDGPQPQLPGPYRPTFRPRRRR